MPWAAWASKRDCSLSRVERLIGTPGGGWASVIRLFQTIVPFKRLDAARHARRARGHGQALGHGQESIMNDWLADFGMFLAQLLSLVVIVGLIVAMVARVRGETTNRTRLRIDELNEIGRAHV